MDPLRLLLISSTAVLSLMLLIEWNQYSDDYNKDQAERYAAEVSRAPGTSPAYSDQTTNARALIRQYQTYQWSLQIQPPSLQRDTPAA